MAGGLLSQQNGLPNPYLLVGVAPLVIVIIGVRLLNKGMIRLTGTNQELIQEIWSGQHNDVIPQRFQNDVALDGITRFLSRAQVCNVCSALSAQSDAECGRQGVQVPVVIVLGIVLGVATLGLFKLLEEVS